MKPDYLERKVTINSDSFIRLCADVAADTAANDAEPLRAAAAVMSLGVLQSALASLLGIGDGPITIGGDTFALACAAHLYSSNDRGKRVVSERDPELHLASLHHLGVEVGLLCQISDKLFGKDEDFETPPAEKGGDEA